MWRHILAIHSRCCYTLKQQELHQPDFNRADTASGQIRPAAASLERRCGRQKDHCFLEEIARQLTPWPGKYVLLADYFCVPAMDEGGTVQPSISAERWMTHFNSVLLPRRPFNRRSRNVLKYLYFRHDFVLPFLILFAFNAHLYARSSSMFQRLKISSGEQPRAKYSPLYCTCRIFDLTPDWTSKFMRQ